MATYRVLKWGVKEKGLKMGDECVFVQKVKKEWPECCCGGIDEVRCVRCVILHWFKECYPTEKFEVGCLNDG